MSFSIDQRETIYVACCERKEKGRLECRYEHPQTCAEHDASHRRSLGAQNLYIYPAKTRRAWISAYFMKSQKRIGVYFLCQNDLEGRKIYDALSEDNVKIREELGNDVIWSWEEGDGAGVRLSCEDVFDPKSRSMIKHFFKEWLNIFVNVMRPRKKGF